MIVSPISISCRVSFLVKDVVIYVNRKYSFYREASYNVDSLGVGGTIEQSVIYSQNNFLPRSVSFNLTTEVFGQNFNVFEVHIYNIQFPKKISPFSSLLVMFSSFSYINKRINIQILLNFFRSEVAKAISTASWNTS